MTEIVDVQDAPDFVEYGQVFVRRRWLIASFFVVCTALVTLLTFLMTPLYRSSTRIIIEGENTNILSAEEASASGMSFDIYENYLETQMALIKSNSIAGKVFEEFKLNTTPRYKEKNFLGKTFANKFIDDIQLKRLPGTRMVEIAVFNPDAKMAADLANRLAEVYSQENLKRRALTYIRNQRMGSLNSEFLRLQSKYDSLSNQFGPKHPEMMALREEIRAMSNRIQKEKNEQGLPAEASSSEEQALLEDTLLQIQESSVISSSRINNIGIVDKALVSKKIAKPKRALNILMGLFVGLFGGIVLAFLVDYMDDSIKSEAHAKKNIGKHIFLGSLLSEKNSGALDVQKAKIDRLMFEDGESASAEAYRILRTRILWSISNHHEFKDLAILSSVPGEGKTTVASNLALSFAQLNKKVLLVDADLRKGRLRESYGLTGEKGLANYLAEKLTFESLVQKTAQPNLSVIVAGKSVIDSSQLFSSAQGAKFIEEARKHFDMIVYDTPPLTIISDASILVRQLGGALLTMRNNVTSARILSKCLTILRESNANLIGVVLNDCASPDNKVYSHYYHSYYKR